MSVLTHAQINRVLAEFMGFRLFEEPYGVGIVDDQGKVPSFSPLDDRNSLSEVVAKLTIDQRRQLHERLGHYRGPCMMWDYNVWLLTCDPAIIARAVAEVVGK